MEYPKGAIKSIEEFQAITTDWPVKVYEASRKFSGNEPTKHTVTGVVVTRKYPYPSKDYVGVELLTLRGEQILSCLDMHLLPQDYNDWYLFVSEEDAMAYLTEVDA